MTNSSTHAPATRFVTAEQRAQYATDGYCVLPAVLSDEDLQLLLTESDRAIEAIHAEMERRGTNVLGGSRRGLQYIPGNVRHQQPELREFLFGALMREVCSELVGPEAHLIWDQFSIKLGAATAGADAGYGTDGNPQSLGTFSWHQDSGYVPADHAPYLTCWIAIDPTTEANGAIRVIPFPEIGVRTRVTHVADPDNGDLTGYFGASTGQLVEVPAGSLVCFSSTLFHSSGRNITDQPRRAYIAQYSPSAAGASGDTIWADAEPV